MDWIEGDPPNLTAPSSFHTSPPWYFQSLKLSIQCVQRFKSRYVAGEEKEKKKKVRKKKRKKKISIQVEVNKHYQKKGG